MPHNKVNLFSKWSFWWFNDLIKKGYKNTILLEDLWQLDETERSATITKRLEDSWSLKANEFISLTRNNCELNIKNEKKQSYKSYKSNESEHIKLKVNINDKNLIFKK